MFYHVLTVSTPPEINTLSLHDALPISAYFVAAGVPLSLFASLAAALLVNARLAHLSALFRTTFFAPVVTTLVAVAVVWRYRSEEHTSELQSLTNLVCRLLLEKKNTFYH